MDIAANVVNDIINWIDNNIDKPLRIKDVAEHAGYSMWHFQRVFVHYQGVSLGRYIRERRLKLAAQALLETDISVYEICLKYGFGSQQTFTRTFSRMFNCPPGLYRKKTLQANKN